MDRNSIGRYGGVAMFGLGLLQVGIGLLSDSLLFVAFGVAIALNGLGFVYYSLSEEGATTVSAPK